jgi:Proline-rich membrane anchor 1
VSALGRRVGVAVTYALAVGRLSLAMASVAAARSPAPPPPEVVPPPPPSHVDDRPALVAIEAPEAQAAEAWRSDLRSMTTVLVCATLVLLAVTAMVIVRG